MVDLTGRQIQILRAVVEKYMQTGEAVGSETIDKKFNFGISPATIRNEMVYLANQGYLRKPHTSAGRIPTAMAIKFYVRELMRERDLSVADEVSVKERIWQNRNQTEELFNETAHIIAERANCIGLVMSYDSNRLYSSGYAHLLGFSEFENVDVTRTVLTLVEEHRAMREIFDFARGDEQVNVILGEDLGNNYLEAVGFVFTEVHVGPGHYNLSVIGPARLDYSYVIPMMKYFRNLLQELIG
jgi:heat-inducible transcriptional repressor